MSFSSFVILTLLFYFILILNYYEKNLPKKIKVKYIESYYVIPVVRY